ncbi:uncharacterized protein LOC119678812 [Teleopsis dalmanni]|uniref:uncharacterized protein LOC119678812 n=1 Tax=Teleopsis dalmanni TaxID=139649 RepID=UPI0018CD5181|nr:uncharacterized protein LOC119678812 [Teleopsis dalmanni]
MSTLPKPDKNAILRAKLLDASRRLRAGKTTVAIQADITPTKLMKEVNLGTQVDLILYKDVGILTDGSYTIKKDFSDSDTDQFILTYSVAQMTDGIIFANASTQTLLPKVSGDDFMKAYYSDNCSTDSEDFDEVEKKLLEQIRKIRAVNHKSYQEKIENINESNDISPTETVIADEVSIRNPNSNNVIEDDSSVKRMTGYLLNKPTFDYWDFDYDGYDKNSIYQSYTIESRKPWKSFLPAELYLRRSLYGKQQFSWGIFLSAVDELLEESNRLVDILESHSRKKINKDFDKNDEVQNLRISMPSKPLLPSVHWLPIIDEQEKELKQLLDKFNKGKDKK